jgi:hypothetical protein
MAKELEGLFSSDSFRCQPLAVKVEWLASAVTRMLQVLGIFFDGYILVENEQANRLYLLLRRSAEALAVDFPEVESALRELVSLFPNLYEAVGHPDSPDENWEFFAPAVVGVLKARLSEAVLEAGTVAVVGESRQAIQAFFAPIDNGIDAYKKVHRRENEAFLEEVTEAAKRARPHFDPMRAEEAPTEPQPKAGRRLYDEAHAAAVEGLIRYLKAQGKEPCPEGTYNVYGERGSVDVYYVEGPPDSPLGLALFEVWTAVDNLNDALRKLDEKARVFPLHLSKASTGATPKLVQAHMVLLATDQNGDLVLRHLDTFKGKFKEGIKSGARYVLWSFDPVIGEVREMLPQSKPDAEVKPLRRFPSKQAFLNAWRNRPSPRRDK